MTVWLLLKYIDLFPSKIKCNYSLHKAVAECILIYFSQKMTPRVAGRRRKGVGGGHTI